jgi:cytochrome c-type biogenesis protein CcmH/NrfG
MRGLTLQRAAVLAAALAALVWLGFRYADAQRIAGVQRVAAAKHPTDAQLESALADARRRVGLDPGTGAESLSYVASLEIRLRRPAAALVALEEIVRREPDTAEAWFLIAQLTRTSDPARSAEARAQLHRLDPRAGPVGH